MLIYCTTNLIDNCKYIGKQQDESKYYYLGSGLHLTRAIKKYGKDNFKKEILIKGIETREELNQIEVYLIAYYGAIKSKDYYNIAPGGDGGQVSEKTNKGKKYPKSMSENLSRSLTGRKLSEKHLANIKLGRKQKQVGWIPVLQFDLDGNFIQEFESVEQARATYNLYSGGISQVCKGKRTKCGGYIWKYKSK